MAKDETDKPTDETPQPEDVDKPPEDDEKTADAVEDIVKSESDEVIEAEDAKAKPEVISTKTKWYKKKPVWISAIVILILAAVFALPLTRYKVLGLFLKQKYAVVIIDSQTSKPVSDATLTLEGKTVITNNVGKATLSVKVGKGTLIINKKYYASYTKNVLVPIKIHAPITYSLVATGRQVPITLTNKVGGAPIANAEVTASGTAAKTDANGQVTIVLPADQSSVSATIAEAGYISSKVTITVTTQSVRANDFQLVPAGNVYFLSNASGTIDVDKSNLDGSNVQTVLKGTGTETLSTTSMLVSPDQKYIALAAQRSASSPSLYIIATSNDEVSRADTAVANLSLDGWTTNDFLVYDISRLGIAQGSANQYAIKSYAANSGELTTIDQNDAQTSGFATASEAFGSITVLANNSIVYTTAWNGDTAAFSGLNDTISTSQASGGTKALLSLPATQYYGYPSSSQTSPLSIYFYYYPSSGSTSADFQYENNKVTQLSGAEASAAEQELNNGNLYFVTASGGKTLWSTSVNGHTGVYVGDSQGAGQKQVALLDNTYSVHGWYNDNYILISKNNNELYVMPVGGVSSASQLVKISNYISSVQGY
jgi:hypothetical protein